MKVFIDRDGCISCGLCVATCPEVFRIASDGLAESVIKIVPKDIEAEVMDAQVNCPVAVIITDR